MKIVRSLSEWRTIRTSMQSQRVGFVPTMGALHFGHQSLLTRSRSECDIVVLSIFVNPTQFNNPNDLKNYPITFDEDVRMASEAGVDYILAPAFDEIYPVGYRYKVSENEYSSRMEGRHRPGHFDGVLTVVMKLLNLVRPARAYFGEKDFQQLTLVQDMVRDFFMPIEIVPCATVREASGLAMSSRNRLLDPDLAPKAKLIHELLVSNSSCQSITEKLNSEGFRVDYIEEHQGRRFAAAFLGNVRLIDNVKK